MNTGVNKFLKISGLLVLPYVPLIILYLILDPFLVVRNFENYYNQKNFSRNQDYVSTEMYRMNREKIKFDSFIFGSSKSQAFKAVEWKKYLKNGNTFHFSANAESVFGIYGKIKYIHSLHDTIRNALLIVDYETFESWNDKGILFIKHPLISNESWFSFQVEFIKAWLQNFFFLKYSYYLMTGTTLPFTTPVLDTRQVIYDLQTNDLYYKHYDDAIAADSTTYYHHSVFQNRRIKNRFTLEIINAKVIEKLEFIARIFREDHTNFKIVISPSFNQQIFNRADLKKLQAIFKEENIYDFSGVNEFTIPIYNYYDGDHYRPFVAQKILEKIYR